MASVPLFVYGTLLDRDVIDVVLGRDTGDVVLREAVLTGYRRVRLPDESYPILIPSPGEDLQGAVLVGLTSSDLDRIRFFENAEYTLVPCTVGVHPEGPVQAQQFSEAVVTPGAVEPWEPESWQRFHKSDFLDDVRRYMALYESMTAQDADVFWSTLSRERER